MTYDPNIAAAKRMARRLSREGGTPHQTVLQAIARASGRADWTAFIADPIPPVEPQGDRPEPMDAGRNGSPAETSMPAPDPTRNRSYAGFLFRPFIPTLLGILISASVLLLPMREETAWVFALGGRIAMLLMIVAMTSSIACGFTALRTRSKSAPGHIRTASITTMVLAIQIAVTVSAGWAMMFSPRWRVSTPSDVSMQVEEDRLNSRHLRFVGWDRDTPIATISDRVGSDPEMVIVPVDDRLRPARRDAPLYIGERAGGAAMSKMLTLHPVFRIRGRLSCRNHVFVPDRFEVADSYVGPMAASHRYDPRWSTRGFTMKPADVSNFCTERSV